MSRFRNIAIKLWRQAKANPKSTIAGIATLAAAFLPAGMGQIVMAVAGGIGLILSQDGTDQHV